MSITLNALADAPFVPYRAKVHSYSSDLVKPDGVDELVLTPVVDFYIFFFGCLLVGLV